MIMLMYNRLYIYKLYKYIFFYVFFMKNRVKHEEVVIGYIIRGDIGRTSFIIEN